MKTAMKMTGLFCALAATVALFILTILVQKSVKQQEAEWAEACSLVAPINDKNAIRTGQSRFADRRTVEGEDIRWEAQAYSPIFKRMERSSDGKIRFYFLPTVPPPGEAIACVTDGKRTFPPLNPEWQLCRTFPELKN